MGPVERRWTHEEGDDNSNIFRGTMYWQRESVLLFAKD